MRESRAFHLEERVVRVIDDVVPTAEVEGLGTALTTASFVRDESDGPDTGHVLTFSRELDRTFLDDGPLHGVPTLVAGMFPDRELELRRVHCNLTVYGDMAYPHRDCSPEKDAVTALYFANPRWERDWGGELLFYEKGDAAAAVAPRPGRLLVFEGALEHRLGIPSRVCWASRWTVAMKFMGPGEVW